MGKSTVNPKAAPREQSIVTQVRTEPDGTPHKKTMATVSPLRGPAHAAPVAVEQTKKKNSRMGLAMLGAATVLLGLAWMVTRGSSGRGETGPRRDLTQIDNLVNKNLLMTNKRIELQEEKARLDNGSSLPAVGDQILPRWKPHQVVGVDQSPDRNELNAAQDLERPPDINMASPDAIIQAEMADKEKKEEFDTQYKEEYARRFIENARAAGYAIELDENFVVKSVKHIKPSSPSLFDGQ